MRASAGLFALFVASTVVVAPSACVPSAAFQTGVDGAPDVANVVETGGDAEAGGPRIEAGADADAAADGDAAPLPAPTPQPFAPVPTIATATGNAQQRHLVYAQNSARYWLFFIDDDPSTLRTAWSTDLVTFTRAAALTLPKTNAGEGRNFSVATASLGGKDVLHLVFAHHAGADRTTWHTRAAINGSTIAWGTPAQISTLNGQDDGSCDPDGPVTTIARDGHVYDATGWFVNNTHCDMDIYKSQTVDNGAAWTSGFAAPQYFGVNQTVNARQLVPMGASDVLGGWDTADIGNTNITSARSTLGVWSDQTSEFATPSMIAPNDFAMCKHSDLDVHAVRRGAALGSSRAYAHGRFDGSAWRGGRPIPDLEAIPNSGVVMLTNGTSILLFSIALDFSVVVLRWDDGPGWSAAWRTVLPPATARGSVVPRAYLAGTGCEDTQHQVLMWTEGATAADYTIVGMDVSTLF